MSSSSVLVLDDGELDDVQGMLEELGVPFGRVRGGAIVEGTPAPAELLISTPRRIDAVSKVADDDVGPIRVVIASEDSNALRDQLRRVGFDFLVRRPVHPEALRLLLLHCLYKGDEKRTDQRVPVGAEVSFRAGLLTRRATLADLSLRGCRLLSRTRIESGRRLRVQIPEALDTGDPFTLTGRVMRCHEDPNAELEPRYSVGVLFDSMSEEAKQALVAVIQDRTLGPATLRPGATRDAGTAADADDFLDASALDPDRTPGDEMPSAVDLEVDVGLEAPHAESSEAPDAVEADASEVRAPRDESVGSAADKDAERRRGRRGAYEQTVPAFGKRALRVLVGRDLSTGGMRIEPLPGIELGDRLHLAIYGSPGEAPFLVWATVSRDDGSNGLGLVFDPIESTLADRLESLVGDLPAVEDLHDGELEAMGTVMSEILER